MTSLISKQFFDTKAAGYRRPLHWVFKVGELKRSVEFFERVFGMRVHRNEEFAEGCDATCNGPYAGRWSKTMVGFHSEDTNFALELTANYGVESYELGNDLRYIAVRNDGFEHRARKAGYPVTEDGGQKFVTDPDGHKFMLVDTDQGQLHEPFLFVSVNVTDVAASAKHYTGVLAADVYTGIPGALGTANSTMVGFTKQSDGDKARFDTVKMELVALPTGEVLDHKQGIGRMAVGTEAGVPTSLAETVKAAADGAKIVHGPLVLKPHMEDLVIVGDPDGYEFCFIVEDSFVITEGAPFVDWAHRDKLHAAAQRWAKRQKTSHASS